MKDEGITIHSDQGTDMDRDPWRDKMDGRNYDKKETINLGRANGKSAEKDKVDEEEEVEEIINEVNEEEEEDEEDTPPPYSPINNECSEEIIVKSEKIPNCKEEIGRELRENNDKICEFICNLKNQREELIYIIEKQYEERKKLETEMERITYKLCLINKSMAQRIKTKNLYDQTIHEIERNYSKLVQDSEAILALIKSQFENLDGMINKKTSTDETLLTSPDEHASGESRVQQNKVCNCHIKIKDRTRRSSHNKRDKKCTCVSKTTKQDEDSD